MKLWQIQTIHGVILVLLLLMLVGCASPSMELNYYSPYDEAEVLKMAKNYKPIVFLPWGELQDKAAELGRRDRVLALTDHKNKIIYIEERFRDDSHDVYIHELAHPYEILELGVSWADSENHKGWYLNPVIRR